MSKSIEDNIQAKGGSGIMANLQEQNKFRKNPHFKSLSFCELPDMNLK